MILSKIYNCQHLETLQILNLLAPICQLSKDIWRPICQISGHTVVTIRAEGEAYSINSSCYVTLS